MADYSGLKALFIGCSLKKSPEVSHTETLMANARAIMEGAGVSTEMIRLVDHDIAFGVYPDMTEHGWDSDAWPDIWEQVKAADILVVGTPIWLGEESSLCRMLIERLYAQSGDTNDKGQYIYYGKAGGCVVTGNEDGIKHVSMSVLYALQHIGYTIPPQADCGWIGEAGPGPSYGDETDDGKARVGFDNEFTRRNTAFMAWNLMHLAAMMKQAGGIPAEGNSREAWDKGHRFGHPNPEYR
ncbi:flavodoxin family protein [Hyphobacterium marinum]|uniref:Flavodoxin family protein n=1 Tax=Hyphobacterium marinum TaxID=3116574 RepID=A0ABU7M1H5_9PROT|nr:flavodoxin family protein [Hyphobacterium sp. Y6023]MEE2567250.1 flavodoxin family protein [Hyphobacterium sp. Y6023]